MEQAKNLQFYFIDFNLVKMIPKPLSKELVPKNFFL